MTAPRHQRLDAHTLVHAISGRVLAEMVAYCPDAELPSQLVVMVAEAESALSILDGAASLPLQSRVEKLLQAATSAPSAIHPATYVCFYGLHEGMRSLR